MNHLIEYGGITGCLTPYIATLETRPFSIMPSANTLRSVVCCKVRECAAYANVKDFLATYVNVSETVEDTMFDTLNSYIGNLATLDFAERKHFALCRMSELIIR